ncbi:MAG: 5'-nucleotidase C-terminal domain-containing protein, partial [Spirochaetota bacterium]
VIIGGHSHTKIEKEQLHNGVLITQAERKLKYATLLKLSVDAKGKVSKSMELLTVDNEGKERADLRAKVDEFNNNPAMRVRIAEAADDFKNYEQIGYLMVDALRVSTGTDIALINPGGVRIDRLPKGAVSVMDIYSMDPFGNEIVLFKLTGHELMSLIKNAYSFDEYLPIYPSGMKTKYLLGKDGEVKTVELFDTKGKPMDLNKVYTVSMNNYMASVYVFDHKDPGTGLFRPTAESMIDYLKELKYIPSYKNEKRVEIVR